MRRLLILPLALVAGCGGGSGSSEPSTSSQPSDSSQSSQSSKPPSSTVKVDIREFKYMPATITVKTGGGVTWVNDDEAGHTSTADDRSFDTQNIERGKKKTVSFSKPGTFAYHCDFHPFMKATVVVK